MDSSKEPIIKRSAKLNHQIFDSKTNSCCDINRETLLDAMSVLMKESSREVLRKDINFKTFSDKFKNVFDEITKLRVNLSDFEAKNIIGKGHFGEVQLVREKYTGDAYAMKILRKDDTLSQRHVAFYEEERDIMAKSNSPWITRLKYAFQDSENLYLVMEFHPGGDLLGLLNKYDDMLPEKMVQFYLAEIVQAIQSLHLMGYVHRDIKPDNILIDRTGHIKLADFGSAARLWSDGKVTSEMPVGTPDYISPEVLTAMNDNSYGSSNNKSSKGYGVECDWWSMGIVAFQLLYGDTPFSDEKIITTYSNIMNHKKSLKFPPNDEEIQVSGCAKSLVRRLLDDAERRINYENLCNHEFFASIDWNNLLHTVPPFVPSLNGQDDTSNFEEFERDKFQTSTSDLKYRTQFCCSNLPFVGFTYNHNILAFNRQDSDRRLSFQNSSFDSSFTDSPSKNKMNSLEVQLKNKNKEIKNLQWKLHEFTNLDAREELETYRTKVSNLEKSLQKSEELIANYKQKEVGLSNEILGLKNMVEVESKMRIASESKAVTLVAAIKEKYKEQAKLKRMEYHRQLEANQTIKAENIETKDNYDEMKVSYDMLFVEHNRMKASFESLMKKHSAAKLGKKNGLDNVHSKLEELCKNTSQQISELQNKLHRTETEKEEAEGKVQELEQLIIEDSKSSMPDYNQSSKIATLKFNAEKNCELYLKLQEEVEKNMKLQNDCSELELRLEELQRDHETLKNNGTVQVVVENTIKTDRNEVCMKDQLFNLHTVQQKLESSVKSLENQTIDSLATFNKEEAEIHQENLHLRAQLKKLEDKVSHLPPDNFDKEYLEKLRKTEESLNDCNLDLRIKCREIKTLEEKLSWGRDTQRDQRTKIRSLEDEVNKFKKAEKEMKKKIEELQAQLKEKESILTSLKSESEIEKAKLGSRIQTLKESCGKAKNLEEQCAKSQGQYDEICKRNDYLESKHRSTQEENGELLKKLDCLKREDSDKAKKIENLELSMKVEKSTVQMLEEQIKDFETIVEMYEEVKDKHESEIKSLNIKINSMTSDNIKEKQLTEKIKKEKDAIDELVKSLKTETNTALSIHESEKESLEGEIEQLRSDLRDLNLKLNDCQKLYDEESVSTNHFAEKNRHLEEYIAEIKEEAAKHITQIASLKKSNLKLTQALGEALDNWEVTKSELKDLNEEADSAGCNYNQERVKMMETIAQQTKLIEFLQQKTENLQQKKKKGLFGGMKMRHNEGPPVQVREQENHVRRERHRKNNSSKDSVDKPAIEFLPNQNHNGNYYKSGTVDSVVPTSPKTRAVLTALVSSPGSNIPTDEQDPEDLGIQHQFRDSLRQPQKQRMHHNIPHRFQQFHAMKGTKCSACLDTIHLGRQAMKCQECSVISHVKCTHAVPSTCGLPAGLVDHFTTAVTKGLPSSPSIMMDRGSDLYEGWVKLPGSNKQGWDKRYMQLNSNQLRLYDKENMKSSPIEVYELNPEKCDSRCSRIIIAGAVAHSELTHTAKSDIPYIFKIEWISQTTCWPGRVLYIMAEGLSQKQLWVVATESVIKKYSLTSDNISLDDGNCNSKVLGNKIVDFQNEAININCTLTLIDKWLLVGSTEGLFITNVQNPANKNLTKLGSIGSVFQLLHVHSLDMVVLLAGASRELKYVSTTQLLSSASSGTPLEIRSLWPNHSVTDCHLISIDDRGQHKLHLAATTADYLSLYRWSNETMSFSKLKDVRTIEPCSCIHFSKHTLLFGTNRFYEMDLSDLSIEEFLDESDSSLAYVVFGASKMNSFPMAILLVSDDDMPTEYLLCFHDFAVFVDEFGRKSRKDELKWSKLPLGINYRAPYLYIIHYTSIEICKIPKSDSCNFTSRAFLDLSSPNYLGNALSESAIYISNCVSHETEILCLQGNIVSEDVESDFISSSDLEAVCQAEEGEDFSFTDSIVASLDGKSED